jgi:hypothetical protein
MNDVFNAAVNAPLVLNDINFTWKHSLLGYDTQTGENSKLNRPIE